MTAHEQSQAALRKLLGDPELIRLVKELGLTDYADVNVSPPTEPGVYLCRVEGLIAASDGFSRFDGKNWSYNYTLPKDAAVANCLSYLSRPGSITRFWRGLAKDPRDVTSVVHNSTAPVKGAIRINL